MILSLSSSLLRYCKRHFLWIYIFLKDSVNFYLSLTYVLLNSSIYIVVLLLTFVLFLWLWIKAVKIWMDRGIGWNSWKQKQTDIKVLEKLRIKKLLMGEIIKDSNQIFCSNQKTSLYKNHNRRKSWKKVGNDRVGKITSINGPTAGFESVPSEQRCVHPLHQPSLWRWHLIDWSMLFLAF